jgi:predicted O-methyltransferase YrrM
MRTISTNGQIFAEFYEYEDGLGYGEEERHEAWRLIEGLIGQVGSLVPEEHRGSFTDAIVDRLRHLDGDIFKGVNPRAKVNAEFEEALLESRRRFADRKAVHLELGTWTAWPAERANEYVENERLGDMIRLDMNPEYSLDIAASVTALPFADETVDRISSNSLLEHVAYPHEVLREAYRVLRPGGMLITTVPFHFVQHDCPRDYLRYSGEFFQDVCGDLGFSNVFVDTTSTSGLYYTLHQFAKAAIVNAEHPHASTARLAHLTVIGLLAALQGMDSAFHADGASFWHSTRMIAVKDGDYAPRNDTFDRTQPLYKRFLQYLICPRTGLPIVEQNDQLVSLDRSQTYDIINNVPNMFVLHGFGSNFTTPASSRQRYAQFVATHGTVGAPEEDHEVDMASDLSHLLDGSLFPSRLTFLDDRQNFYRRFLKPDTATALNKAIFAPSFAGATDPTALSFLAMLCMNTQPNRVLELGTYYGFTTLVLADLLSTNSRPGRIVTVDIAAKPQENAISSIQEAGLTHVVDFIHGSSTDPETVEAVEQHSPYDLVYIDSSHQYQSTLDELNLYLATRRVIRPSGLVVLHDITLNLGEDQGVGAAVEDWIRLHPDFRYLPLTCAGIWPNAAGLGIILAPA